MKKFLAVGLATTLLLSAGAQVDAKPKFIDKNKNGIEDKWEKKYKLKGKNVAKLDTDKDGLNNFVEYKLSLNPTKKDTNKNGVADALEDTDRDGISNGTELELGLKPYTAYSKSKKVKDGNLKDTDGVKWSEKVRELEISVESGKKEFELEYEKKKGKAKIKLKQKGYNLDQATVRALVTDLQKAIDDNLTEDQILDLIQSRFELTGTYEIEVELEYMNGDEFEIEREVEVDDEDDADDEEMIDEDDQDDENQDEDQDVVVEVPAI